MFQEQEERLAEQERRIARQGETISKMEETIAEQQKTIEEQNETIQMIAKYPDLRDFLHGFKTEASLREDLGKFNLSMLMVTIHSQRVTEILVFHRMTKFDFPPHFLVWWHGAQLSNDV